MSFLHTTPRYTRPFVLIILDGFGLAPPSKGNAIFLAHTPNYDRLIQQYPHGQLIAAGESVGLPATEVGNTEVGHLTIGSGRVIKQDLVRINEAVSGGDLVHNEGLLEAVAHVRRYNSRLHLISLIGEGKVHSSMDHVYGLVEALRQLGVNQVRFHAITDGRDSHPTACRQVASELENELVNQGVGRIVSISGRYYAMDRDRRWERIEQTYRALVEGKGVVGQDVDSVFEINYSGEITDEFIQPTLIGDTQSCIMKHNDAVFFVNFRVDRPKELTTALILPDFERFRSFSNGFNIDGKPMNGPEEFATTFERGTILTNLFMVTMTEYQAHLPVAAIAFPKPTLSDSLSHVIDAAELPHLHVAESEKERFVTFYMTGMQEGELPHQKTIIHHSPRVATYNKKPEMSLYKITKTLERAISGGEYAFIVANFANPDMVAHTGDLAATLQALEHVDTALGRLEKAVLKTQGVMLITADHGNAEDLLTFPQEGYFYTTSEGKMNTEHSSNPVPVIMVGSRYKDRGMVIPQGTLADVAPTVLHWLGLPAPVSMTGRSLLPEV